MRFKTAELMNALNNQGQYELTDFDAEILDLFAAGICDWGRNGSRNQACLMSQILISRDPYTAVAPAAYKKYTKLLLADATKTVIASTAKPYKFPVVAVEAVIGKSGLTDFEALLNYMNFRSGCATCSWRTWNSSPVVTKTTVAAADMQAAVELI